MDFKSYFDIPEGLLYFNTPGNGLLPKSHNTWREERDQTFYTPHGTLRDTQGDFVEQVRGDIARLFHTTSSSVFCVPNFSFGYNTLLAGLPIDLPVILLEGEYPSVHYPLYSRGFKCVKIKMDEQLEQNIKNAILPNTAQVLLLSIVQYISGAKIDLDFIKELKQLNPQLYIVGDATQYLGVTHFDFDNSGFDAIGASGYKWLMAGFGNGFMLINERLRATLYQEAQQKSLPSEAMWAGKSLLHIYFEPGHIDTLALGTLWQSILFLEQLNLKNINKHLVTLTEHAYRELDDRHLLLPIARLRKEKSSLINIQLNPNLYPKLVESGIRCFPRGTGIRIGIHLYNNADDLSKLLKIIDAL